MTPQHLACIICNRLSYEAKQSNFDRLQCCQNNAAMIISKGTSLTILALCWENCTGFPWNIGSVTKFCSSPTRHWMAMLHNISQRLYQNRYHHGPFVRRINISSIHHEGGLKHLESELSPKQSRPLGLSTPQREASSIYLFSQGQT